MRGLILCALVAGCMMRRADTTPRAHEITGTCDGACEHYVMCKPGHADADLARCTRECPTVFDDEDSLIAYESMTCEEAVEYVDGSAHTVSQLQ